MDAMITPVAQRAIQVLRKRHFRPIVVGRGEPPSAPTFIPGLRSGVWLETIARAPVEARDSLLALQTAGITVKAIVMVHEAPRLLTGTNPNAAFDSQAILSDFARVAGGIGKAVLAVAQVFVLFAAVVPMFFLPLLLIDPAVIAVLDDGEGSAGQGGTWLMVSQWYE